MPTMCQSLSLVALALVLAAGAGCVRTIRSSASAAENVEHARWVGTVTYEARDATPQGASAAVSVRPARYVDIFARDETGRILVHTQTDASGSFVLVAPVTIVDVIAVAHAFVRGHDVAVTHDPMGTVPHAIAVRAGPPSVPLTIAAADDVPGGPAGAFHIVDTVLRGLEAVRAWTGQLLPPLFVFWGRGVTSGWSYYRGERPERSGRFALELLGGAPGQHTTTDTDEHDETIILHELGHFVMDRLSTDSSVGGNHPAGFLIDPGLAWEEGRATWFAVAVAGRPIYRDTIGREPGGRLRVDHDLERRGQGPRGIGSEQGVSEILWDLADGAGGLPDADRDGVALGPAVVLRSMLALGTEPGAYPCLPTFLRYLIRAGAIGDAPLRAMLTATGQPADLVPRDDRALWPTDLSLPGRASGKIDGASDPAPSGGPRRPENGVDAVRAYRIHLSGTRRVRARLRIFGTGRGRDGQDIDLELRTIRADLIARSDGETPLEVIGARLPPGWYVVYVRDGGRGNRAEYELDISAD